MRFSLKKLLLVVTFVAVAFGSVASYRNYFASHRSHTTAAVANRMIWPDHRLPPEAADVTYEVDFGGCEAEFAISEGAFLNWCESCGFEVTAIEKVVPYHDGVIMPLDSRAVAKGYAFDVPAGRGVFDVNRSRAAFWASTLP